MSCKLYRTTICTQYKLVLYIAAIIVFCAYLQEGRRTFQLHALKIEYRKHKIEKFIVKPFSRQPGCRAYIDDIVQDCEFTNVLVLLKSTSSKAQERTNIFWYINRYLSQVVLGFLPYVSVYSLIFELGPSILFDMYYGNKYLITSMYRFWQ